MPKVHVKKDDKVQVISGKDKGKRARVLETLPRESKVLVEGVNVMKKHTRPRSTKVLQGGILEKAMPIHSSKVMLVCPHCDKPIRVSHRITDSGIKERVCPKCNEVIT